VETLIDLIKSKKKSIVLLPETKLKAMEAIKIRKT
jgi:hypothetical protein